MIHVSGEIIVSLKFVSLYELKLSFQRTIFMKIRKRLDVTDNAWNQLIFEL